MVLIEFQPYRWQETKDDGGNLELLAWSYDKDSNKVLIRTKHFPYFCRIELPATIGGMKYEWNDTNAEDVRSMIAFMLKTESLISSEFHIKQNLYNHNDMKGYITVYFSTEEGLRKCYNLFNEKRIKIMTLIEDNGRRYRVPKFSEPIFLRVWEKHISPITKLVSHRRLENCNWTECDVKLVSTKKKRSKVDREYIAHFKELKSISRDYITEPMLASLDIEVYSKNKRCFPNEWKTSDVSYMINIVFQRANHPETRDSHCIIMADVNDVEGITIHRVKTEKQLIYKMVELINEYDAEMIITYNGMAFDWKYLNTRLEKNDYEWPDMSLLLNDKTFIEVRTWESKAFGTNFNYIPHTSGRTHVDMLLIIKRAVKLNEYNLNFVSKKFLNKTKHDLPAYEMFLIYENVARARRDYDKYKKTDDAIYYKKKLDKAAEKMTKTIKYCEQDCILPLELFEFFGTYQDLMQSCNIFCVNPEDMFTKGAQAKGINQVYKKVYQSGYVMNYVKPTIRTYAGAHVFTPIEGKHGCIICLDFKSLYPSIIISNNMCWSTYIPKEKWSLYSSDEYIVIMVRQKEKVNPGDPKCKEYRKVTYEHRFHKSRALLCEILNELLDERSKVRKLESAEKDKIKRGVYTARQNALKVGANGLYGLCGMSEEAGGKLTQIPIASSTTYLGKIAIKNRVRPHVENIYGGRLVYGDTDSGFVDLGLKDPKDCLYWGVRLSHEITGGPELVNPEGLQVTFPASEGLFSDTYTRKMQIEYEKGLMVVLLTKKRYSCLLINKRGEYSTKIESVLHKGNMAAKRERCKFIKDLYATIMHMCLLDKTFYEVIKYLRDRIKLLFDGKIDHSELYELKNMGKNYSSDSYPLKILSDRLISIGREMKPGSRMSLVIVKTDNSKDKLGHKLRLYEEYLESLETDNPYEIDYFYYVEKLLTKQLDQLIGIVYKQQIETKYKKIIYKSGRTQIKLNEPCKMLIKMMQQGYSFNKIVKAIEIIDSK